MFCGNCGKLVKEGSKFCTGCGQKITPIGSGAVHEEKVNTVNSNPIEYKNESSQNSTNYTTTNNDDVIRKTQDKVNVWLVIVGILIPIVGLILFLVYNKETPKKANAIGIASLISFILGIVIWPVIFVGMFAYIGNSVIYEVEDHFNENFYDEYYDEYDEEYEKYFDEYEDEIEENFNKLEKEIEEFYEDRKI